MHYPSLMYTMNKICNFAKSLCTCGWMFFKPQQHRYIYLSHQTQTKKSILKSCFSKRAVYQIVSSLFIRFIKYPSKLDGEMISVLKKSSKEKFSEEFPMKERSISCIAFYNKNENCGEITRMFRFL